MHIPVFFLQVWQPRDPGGSFETFLSLTAQRLRGCPESCGCGKFQDEPTGNVRKFQEFWNFKQFFFSEKYYREPVLPNWLTLSGLDEKLGFWDSCNVFFIVVFHIECFVKLSEQDSELQNQRYMLGISSLSASHVFDRKTKTRCRKNNAEFPVSLSQQIPVCRIVQNFFSPQLPRRPCTAITSGSIGTSLTSFASAAWDELRFQKARKCGPNSHRCFAVPGQYKWHRVNSGSFHRWRCHRPGHPVESQFLTNH